MSKPLFVEEIKALDGQYFNLEGHAIRIDRTVRYFFHKPFIQSTLRRQLPDPPSKGMHKCTILYDENIISIGLMPYTIPKITSLALVAVKNIDFIFKLNDRHILEKIRLFSKADDAILIQNSFVTNTSNSNLVFEDEDGAFWTPLHYIHSGTKREFYLKQKKVFTYPIKAANILLYPKVYVINSMIDIEDNVSLPTREILPIVDFIPEKKP
ncbi:MAG: hypothetical protein LBE38_08350 [Deltaproteobacteria bacterium]|jgi:4-amino-4-deoxychorismate lyase|nr:hypothetical protein [Deltaproteobacteria bacterium]